LRASRQKWLPGKTRPGWEGAIALPTH
jgi:hypothetical protein